MFTEEATLTSNEYFNLLYVRFWHKADVRGRIIGKRKADDPDCQYLIACGLIYGLLRNRFTDHDHQHRNVFFSGIPHPHNDNN